MNTKYVEFGEMSSRDIMSIAATVDFAKSDSALVAKVQVDFNEAIENIQKIGMVKVSAFVVNVVGENDKGEMVGGYASSGYAGTLITMLPFLHEQIRKTLKDNGACGCERCYIKTVAMLLDEVNEIYAAQEAADHAVKN